MRVPVTKYIFTIIVLLFVIFSAGAQDYKYSIKIKPPAQFGISYKWLNGFEKGYELMLGKISNGYNFTVLRVYQNPAFPRISDKWFICYGFGSHVSAYDSYSIDNPFKPFDSSNNYKRSFISVGFDGYAGLEYRFLKHPFTLNIDYIPNFEALGPNYFRVNCYLTFGLAVVF